MGIFMGFMFGVVCIIALAFMYYAHERITELETKVRSLQLNLQTIKRHLDMHGNLSDVEWTIIGGRTKE